MFLISSAYMEAVMTLGSAAVVGFAVAYALIGVTWENYRGTWVEVRLSHIYIIIFLCLFRYLYIHDLTH